MFIKQLLFCLIGCLCVNAAIADAKTICGNVECNASINDKFVFCLNDGFEYLCNADKLKWMEMGPMNDPAEESSFFIDKKDGWKNMGTPKFLKNKHVNLWAKNPEKIGSNAYDMEKFYFVCKKGFVSTGISAFDGDPCVNNLQKQPKIVNKSVGKDNKYITAKNHLNDLFNDAHADAWRTADGKFNTVRLASDIGAGVVLGTVGGVVSGVVIKKKQIEKGFEALKCSVGGQNVATWGDTFTVGLTE